MEGKAVTEIAKALGIRRQDLYERSEWAPVRHLLSTRKSVRRQAKADRSGQIPDTEENLESLE